MVIVDELLVETAAPIEMSPFVCEEGPGDSCLTSAADAHLLQPARAFRRAGGVRLALPNIARIARTTAEALRRGCTPLQEPEIDPAHRTSVLVYSTPDYDVWILRWPHGTRVDPHDHGESAAAFSVVSGELLEVRWQEGEPKHRRIADSTVVTVDAGVVHDVVGATPSALSVHVYSPPLSAMGFYDPSGTRRVRTEEVDRENPHEEGASGPPVAAGSH